MLKNSHALAEPRLNELQRRWSEEILRSDIDEVDESALHLNDGHHFAVYHYAYAARLCEVLADVFEKTRLYLGSDLFEQLSTHYAREQPPSAPHLALFGATFPNYLFTQYPAHSELLELSLMEWRLRACFLAKNEVGRAANRLSELACLSKKSPLLSHLTIDPITYNVPAIWNAIHRDEEVPELALLASATHLLTWRKDFQPHFYAVTGLESQLLLSMYAGCSVSEAFEQHSAALANADQAKVASYLKNWADLGILV